MLKNYLKEHLKGIILYMLLMGLFFLVFYLYGVRLDAVAYAEVLGFVCFLIYGAVDIAGYRKRSVQLEEAKSLSFINPDVLPLPATREEGCYQEMIQRLYEEKIEMESAVRISRQEMKDYYGMWVHQIKTPIAAMHVLLQAEEEYLTQSEWGGESMSRMKTMKQEMFKIEQYVEMVLTYLRMEEMSSDLSFETCDLDQIVKQAVRKYSQMFILKKIRLEYQPLGIQILTDKKWLTFVIEQLLSNALKYTREGSIRIFLEQGNLVIEDTGIGIQPEDLPRVFEKGFTGYNGRTDQKSTGIGLYLCKSVMCKMRSRIWIKSEVARGTKVYLGLKRHVTHLE